MNIFFVNLDPFNAASDLVDKHVVKMIVESAQLLSTAHRVLDGKETTIIQNGRRKKTWQLDDSRDYEMYQATHINHPSAIWVRESIENYNWLVDHFDGLLQEYTRRYERTHKCQAMLVTLQNPPFNLKAWDMTPAPSCVAEDCLIGDLVTNYRAYYNKHKSHMYSWKKRSPPEWAILQ